MFDLVGETFCEEEIKEWLYLNEGVIFESVT